MTNQEMIAAVKKWRRDVAENGKETGSFHSPDGSCEIGPKYREMFAEHILGDSSRMYSLPPGTVIGRKYHQGFGEHQPRLHDLAIGNNCLIVVATMILKNLTQNTILSRDLKICTSLPDLSLGLLNPQNPRSLLFKTRFGLHTFGLKQAIDVLVLDGQNRVVMIGENLKPNRLFFWNPIFDSVVELPKGNLEQTKTVVGDQLELSQETVRT